MPREEGVRQNLVLAPETRQRRHARNGDCADEERPVRHGHLVLEAPHVAHVLLLILGRVVQRVDDAAAPQKEQALEEGVRHQVEDGGREGAHAQRHEHEAELAHRAVGEHALDVVLHQADARGEQARERADDGDDAHGVRPHDVDGARARDHVDARRHHGGGVDERAHRGRAFHGVGQPDVERNLRALADGADEQQKTDGRRHRRAHLGRGLEDFRVGEAARQRPDEEHAQQEARVADAVDDERLLARVGRGLLLVPEADEQVAAKAHALPADEHDEIVVPQHQEEHREHEQVEIGEKSRVARVAVHVAHGVYVHQKAHARHHEQHDGAERIDQEAHRGAEAPRFHPRPERHGVAAARAENHLRSDAQHDEKRQARHDGSDGARLLAHVPSEESVDQDPDHRKNGNEPSQFDHDSPTTSKG